MMIGDKINQTMTALHLAPSSTNQASC